MLQADREKADAERRAAEELQRAEQVPYPSLSNTSPCL